MKLTAYAIIFMFFIFINQSFARTWQCAEKTSDQEIKYTILFDSVESDTNLISMRSVNTQINQNASAEINLKIIREYDDKKVGVLTNPYVIIFYYFDLKRRLVTRSKITGNIANSRSKKSLYKCQIYNSVVGFN